MKRCVLVLLAVLSLAEVTKGQDGNNVTYYLSNLPQRVRINPAYQPDYKVWIGVSFAFLKTTILLPTLIIAFTTFFLSLSGVCCGSYFGKIKGFNVELLGGIILVGIGIKILIEHTCFQ